MERWHTFRAKNNLLQSYLSRIQALEQNIVALERRVDLQANQIQLLRESSHVVRNDSMGKNEASLSRFLCDLMRDLYTSRGRALPHIYPLTYSHVQRWNTISHAMLKNCNSTLIWQFRVPCDHTLVFYGWHSSVPLPVINQILVNAIIFNEIENMRVYSARGKSLWTLDQIGIAKENDLFEFQITNPSDMLYPSLLPGELFPLGYLITDRTF